MLKSQLKCLELIGLEGTFLKDSNGRNDGEGVWAGDLGALSEARSQNIPTKECFRCIGRYGAPIPIPENPDDFFCLSCHPNSPRIEQFLPQSLRFDYLT